MTELSANHCWLKIQRESGDEIREVDTSLPEWRVDGECPGCGQAPWSITLATPFERYTDHLERAGSVCVWCGDSVGYAYRELPTIFGAEEDRNVLELGRARVYR